MFRFTIRRLGTGLALSYVAVALIPILVLGLVAFQSSKSALENTEYEKLAAERDLRKRELVNYLQDTLQSLLFMASTPAVKTAFDELNAYRVLTSTAPDAPLDVKSSEYWEMYKNVDPFFASFLKTHESAVSGYHDVLLVAAEGNVLYSAGKLSDLGATLRKGPLKESGLAVLWKRVVETGKPALVDFSRYAPGDSSAAFLGVPIASPEKDVAAVLAVRLGSEKIDSVFGTGQGSQKIAGAYLVGADLALRSAMQQKGETSSDKKADPLLVREALAGNAGTTARIDASGTPLLTAYAGVDLKSLAQLGADFDWAVIADVEQSNALAPVHAIRSRILVMGVGVALIAIIVAYFTGRRIARPVTEVSELMGRLSHGDLTGTVPKTRRQDELGSLINAAGSMVKSMRGQTKAILDGVEVLSKAASEITTMVAEMATSASQTSTAVSETSSTAEQVKLTARFVSERAKSVAQSAKQAVSVSEDGRKATEDIAARMNLIKEQMDSIGHTVVRLSDQGRAIEEITGTVKDLADQSNLLAVNASIEAARAGDRGKGFAVVAQEIKTLADQSREATEQIRAILDDTRSAVSAVVMATEQGIKAVESGVEQSVVSGKSIEALGTSVGKSAEEAALIETSSEQQHLGVDQVAEAMVSIESALKQSLQVTSRLESSIREIEGLGASLRTLVAVFKL